MVVCPNDAAAGETCIVWITRTSQGCEVSADKRRLCPQRHDPVWYASDKIISRVRAFIFRERSNHRSPPSRASLVHLPVDHVIWTLAVHAMVHGGYTE